MNTPLDPSVIGDQPTVTEKPFAAASFATGETPPVTLTLAGSDSGGGAGIQADLKTMTVLGCFGTSVITALTAQNGAGVLGIHEVPADFVRLQIQAVRQGFPVKAAKIGMAASVEIIEALADSLADKDFSLIVDPVCVSQSGHKLLRDDAVETLKRRLVPLADLITPNRPEAELLCGFAVNDEADVLRAGETLLRMGAKAVLIKAGHFAETGEVMTDRLILADGKLLCLPHARVDTSNNHGTGCTLSAAITARIALGDPLPLAIQNAQAYLVRALRHGFAPGIGAGPPNFSAGIEA